MIKTFNEYVDKREFDEWLLSQPKSAKRALEKNAYQLIDKYKEELENSSGTSERDDFRSIPIKYSSDHKGLIKRISELFSRVYELERGSDKLTPSFLSNTSFEKIARYAKRVLGHHADEIGTYLSQINRESSSYLFDIWRPGSWIGRLA